MDDFSLNLRLACSQHPSISHICRRIGINRQQFNKYLSGSVQPSRHNMARISEYLGLNPSDLLIEHSKFSVLLHERNQRSMGDSRLKLRLGYLDEVYQNSTRRLQKYLGYYHTYFYSLAAPGMITKSLINLFEDDGRIYSKGIEVIRESGERLSNAFLFKYLGSVAYLEETIYIREHETLVKGTISQTTLMPSHHSRVGLLSGLTLGVPSTRGRVPAAARIIFQKLDPQYNLKVALGECGRFNAHSDAVPDKVEAMIRNQINNQEQVLYASNHS
ncbi:helix-turn-helix transcriptional regulator [Kiloniella laminariae]|uniref:Helix-turn-helix transcriptional regulator n=2 Tax=Kiloniella laminariae TaxID=454162 RepID=A0ABT4LM17_9PROT|nr:helix-turn-helix transcriptional regulator [Kiloniella laminariae]MCZ4282137.1 helix-turn-helix transcriptional regulator [Kiloniella laminariae]